MPQSASRKHGLALSLCAAIVLGGCSVTRLGPPPGVAVIVGPGDGNGVLRLVEVITGGSRLGYPGVLNTLAGGEIHLVRPVAVGGYGADIYIADAGSRALYRYDALRRGLFELKDAGSLLVGEASQIYAAADQTFYVVDPLGNQVVQFDRDGNLIRAFKNPANVPQPVAVAVDHKSGQVQIADGTHGYVVVFNKVGQALFATGSRGDDKGQFRMITSMSQGPDGLYVADRLRNDIQVLGKEGDYLYSFGKGDVFNPSAIAVDRYNRVYVADAHDNKIKIFRDGKLMITTGNSGNAPGQFNGITDMWLSEDNKLYVADGLNNRLQVFQVLPGNKPLKK